MAYFDITTSTPKDEGTYMVQVLTIKGYIREAKAKWQKQKGFDLISSSLQPDEFIKAWWQY